MVEIPFVINNIEIHNPCNVLSFGSFNDIVAIELSSLGCFVTAFDLERNVFSHPSFKSVIGDFLDTAKSFDDCSFNAAYALSSLEHVGLKVYGQRPVEDGDKQVVKIIERLLKPDGQFILTVPFGRSGVYPKKKPTYRKYDLKSLNVLLSSFESISINCYGDDSSGNWLPKHSQDLEGSDTDVPNGVACIVAKKRS